MRIVIDNFFNNFEEIRAVCDDLEYDAQVNPFDSVVYQGICSDIPDEIHNKVIGAITQWFGKAPQQPTMFFRLSTEGVEVPHPSHNDANMGNWALMIYMNREQHCNGGTDFVDHVSVPMPFGPVTQKDIKVWEEDNNDKSKWKLLDTVKMHPNKAILFNSAMMHRAAEPAAFGTDAKDGRLMLICFFTI